MALHGHHRHGGEVIKNTYVVRVSTPLSIDKLVTHIQEHPNTRVEAISLKERAGIRGPDKQPRKVNPEAVAKVAETNRMKGEATVDRLIKVMQEHPKAVDNLNVLADLMNRAGHRTIRQQPWAAGSLEVYWHRALAKMTAPGK
jgi:hypothetical protein